MFTHLLNDYSGSPLVLRQTIEGFIKNGYPVSLYTNSNTKGFLSDIKDCTYFTFTYKWRKNKLVTFAQLLISQLVLFYNLLLKTRKFDVLYINTILPFGAALAGMVLRKPVIYHIHETSIKPFWWKQFLFFITKKTACHIFYVSHFLKEEEPIVEVSSTVVYNALSEKFVSKAEEYLSTQKTKNNSPRILMLSSLKKYKGVDVFYELAKARPNSIFDLVLNAEQADIEHYFSNRKTLSNLNLYSKQADVHPFYQQADLVMNLSLPDQWKETFGMTALEAMQYGKPVIVPPVGGIAEIVEHGVEGFKIDSNDTQTLLTTLDELLDNDTLYKELSVNCITKAGYFNVEKMQQKLIKQVNINTPCLSKPNQKKYKYA